MTKKQLQLAALAITFFSNFATKTMFLGRLFSKSPFVSSAATGSLGLASEILASEITGTLGLASYHKAFSNTQTAVVLAASAGDGAPMPLNLPIKHQPTGYTENATETNSSPSFSIGSFLQNNGIAIAALVVGAASLAYTYYTNNYTNKEIRKLKAALQSNFNLIETNRNATKSDVSELIALGIANKNELAGQINAMKNLTTEQHVQMLNKIDTLENLTKEQKNELIKLLTSKFEESKAHTDLVKKELIETIKTTAISVKDDNRRQADRIIGAFNQQAKPETATTKSLMHSVLNGGSYHFAREVLKVKCSNHTTTDSNNE